MNVPVQFSEAVEVADFSDTAQGLDHFDHGVRISLPARMTWNLW